MKLYLAHPVKERFHVRDKIQPLLEAAGIEIINPFMYNGREKIFFNEEYRDNLMKLEENEQKEYDHNHIVETELEMIKNCDGIIAYLPYEGIGTSMELFFNSVVLGRGVERTFVFVDWRDEESHYIVKHPWLLTFTTVSEHLKELLEKIEKV